MKLKTETDLFPYLQIREPYPPDLLPKYVLNCSSLHLYYHHLSLSHIHVASTNCQVLLKSFLLLHPISPLKYILPSACDFETNHQISSLSYLNFSVPFQCSLNDNILSTWLPNMSQITSLTSCLQVSHHITYCAWAKLVFLLPLKQYPACYYMG